MKSFTAIALVVAALVGSLSVEAAPLDKRQTQTISQAWCKEFDQGCVAASREICGNAPSFTWTAKCHSSFTNNVCTSMNSSCSCTPLNGSAQDATSSALQKTFVATSGTCSNVPTIDPPAPSPEPETPEPEKTSSSSKTPEPTDAPVSPPSTTGAPAPSGTVAPVVAVPSASGSGPLPSTVAEVPKSDASVNKITGAALTVAVSVGLALMNL